MSIKEELNENADNYAFRVPYDGSNDFYDKKALKSFNEGAKCALRLVEKRLRQLEEVRFSVLSDYKAEDIEQLIKEIEE